jgi:L-ascorbate metabolism protein UlaG (beta-lactamase superfamily)
MNETKTFDRIEFTFLGQAGFIIVFGDLDILIDPYLSNYVVDSGIGSKELFSREFPPPFEVKDLPKAKYIFITHDHADHCDPDTLLPIYKENLRVKFICPRPAAEHLEQMKIKDRNIIVPEALKLNKVTGMEYYAVPAAHYGLDKDDVTGEYSYFAYVIKIGGKWIFHAGDTINYGGFTEYILSHTQHIDVACLPVNGRDTIRESQGIIGNLDGEEALYLARDIKSEYFFPIHNDLFASNHVSQTLLADLIERRKPKQKIHWLKPGEKFILP